MIHTATYPPKFPLPAMWSYRYFFNGQEADNEVLGEEAMHAFEYRMHDTRIGRFWSVDPLAGKFPWNSVYAFAENMPTWARELEGLEADVNANDNRVAIDPGHGIKGTKNSKVDPGAVGNDFYEKDITLSISESVNKHLSEWGLETTMTRTGDLTIDQEQISYRISVAHDFDADLFVSIHTNSTTNPDVRGFLVCYNPNNKINGENSLLLAESIVSPQAIDPIFNNGLQPRDKLGVLNQFKGTASVLVEVGFISNNNDVLLMTQNADEIGREIALGVYKYLYNKEPSPPVQPSLKMPELMYPITPQDNLKIGNNPMGGW